MQYLRTARRVEKQMFEVFLLLHEVNSVKFVVYGFSQCFWVANSATLTEEIVVGLDLLPEEDGVVEVAAFSTSQQRCKFHREHGAFGRDGHGKEETVPADHRSLRGIIHALVLGFNLHQKPFLPMTGKIHVE